MFQIIHNSFANDYRSTNLRLNDIKLDSEESYLEKVKYVLKEKTRHQICIILQVHFITYINVQFLSNISSVVHFMTYINLEFLCKF